MDWHGQRTLRRGLRPLGIALLLVACAAGHRLIAIGAGHGGYPPAIAYLLALIVFLCCSAGGALLVHGHHLFDTIRLSGRWRRLPVEPPRRAD